MVLGGLIIVIIGGVIYFSQDRVEPQGTAVRVFTEKQGGTATSSTPTQSGEFLIWNNTTGRYDTNRITAGNNITLTPSDGNLTIDASGGGASFGQAWELNPSGNLTPTTTLTVDVNVFNATSTSATSTAIHLWTNFFQSGSFVEAQFFTATSTTATSTLSGNIDIGGDNNTDGQRCFDDTSCISDWVDITSEDALVETPGGAINGSNVDFTLTENPSDNDNVIISVNGQVQRNGTDVTIAGTAVTFTLAPETGWTILAHYNRSTSVFQPGLKSTVTTKTGNYTVQNTDGTIRMDNSSEATVTLPTAVGITGQIFSVKKINAAAVNVIIDGDGSETIDGAATLTISNQFDSAQLQSNGVNWDIQ